MPKDTLGGKRGATSKIEPTKTDVHNKGVDEIIKKYGYAIEEINKDPEPYWAGGGYWVYLRAGYISPDMDGQTIHEANINDVKSYLKNVRKATKEELRSIGGK